MFVCCEFVRSGCAVRLALGLLLPRLLRRVAELLVLEPERAIVDAVHPGRLAESDALEPNRLQCPNEVLVLPNQFPFAAAGAGFPFGRCCRLFWFHAHVRVRRRLSRRHAVHRLAQIVRIQVYDHFVVDDQIVGSRL